MTTGLAASAAVENSATAKIGRLVKRALGKRIRPPEARNDSPFRPSETNRRWRPNAFSFSPAWQQGVIASFEAQLFLRPAWQRFLPAQAFSREQLSWEAPIWRRASRAQQQSCAAQEPASLAAWLVLAARLWFQVSQAQRPAFQLSLARAPRRRACLG